MKRVIKWLRGQGRRVFTKVARVGARGLGFQLLDREATNAFLAPYLRLTQAGETLTLPSVADAAQPDKLVFTPTDITTRPTYVWAYEPRQEPAKVLPCGVVLAGRRVLHTDYWINDLFTDVLNPRRRKLVTVDTLIAPFSHYFDGDVFVGYYDFMFLVAAKLCRIRQTMSADAFARAAVAYPLMGTAFEREMLTILGFSADRIFDTRQTDVRFTRCLIGSHDNWAHQNSADIMALKQHVESRLAIRRTAQNRIYISRACRRRVRNEEALVALLLRYDFQIIDDKPRSIAEQCALYKNASIIVGPHGASFANLIWCEPGTELLELFPPDYTPNYFQYIAEVMGLRYSALHQGPAVRFDVGAIEQDLTVSLPDLERCLDALLGSPVALPANQL